MTLHDVTMDVSDQSDRPHDVRPLSDHPVGETPIPGDANSADMFDDVVQLPGHHAVRVDRSRDSLLTDFGKATDRKSVV